MKSAKALGISALMSSVILLTAVPGIPQDKGDRSRISQNTANQDKSNGNNEFREYLRAHNKKYEATVRRIRERQAFEGRYLSNGD